MTHRILVIGGTGNVGGEVLSQLPATGVRVRALARNPDAARLPSHVEVVGGDLTRPETLDACLDGIDAVFPLFQQPNPLRGLHAGMERLIEAAGCEWTFLRPGMFAANALGWWASEIRAGDVVRWPHLAAPTAPVHERDIAAVAVQKTSRPTRRGESSRCRSWS